jgi:ethanolamine transporter EutH
MYSVSGYGRPNCRVSPCAGWNSFLCFQRANSGEDFVKSLQRIIAVLLGIVGLALVVPLFRNILSSVFFIFLWVGSFPILLLSLLARSIGSRPKRKDLD